MRRLLIILAGALSLELAFVVETFRHGARSPIDPYSWDQGSWPQGYGELTAEGMRQEYLNGVEFRNRYIVNNPLLNENYLSYQIYVRSTDLNRTIMSAQSQLSGFYPLGPTINSTQVAGAVPPLNVQSLSVIQQKLGLAAVQGQYSPIPIHVVAGEYDYMLRGYDESVCPAFIRINAEVQSSPDYQQRVANFTISGLQSQLEEVFNTTIDDYCTAGWFGDTVKCDIAAGFPIPSGLTPDLINEIYSIQSYCNSYFFTTEGAKLASSTFFNAVISHFDYRILNSLPLRYALYSAHDTTLAGFLSGLGVYNSVFNGVNPPFASSLLFELYKDNTLYYVKVVYNDTPVILPGCGVVLCPYTVFRGLLELQTYPNITAACQNSLAEA